MFKYIDAMHTNVDQVNFKIVTLVTKFGNYYQPYFKAKQLHMFLVLLV